MTPQIGEFVSSATSPIIRTESRRVLGQWFHAWGFRSGAEIGVWEGHFSEELCRANPGVRMRCVDPWQSYLGYDDPKNDQDRLDHAFRATRKRLRPYRCTIQRMTSLEAAADVADQSLDYIYLDANHGEASVYADLCAWVPKVRSGGVVAGHDYVIGKKYAHLHVQPAVDRFIGARNIAPLVLLTGDKLPSFMWVAP